MTIGCASSQNKAQPQATPPQQSTPPSEADTLVNETLRLREIQGELAMERAIDQLGFAERPYKGKYFSVLYFRLQCRSTEGTVEYMSESELRPLRSDNLVWMVGKNKGKITTDQAGYGQIRMLAGEGSKNKRLILKSGNEILGLRLKDASNFIVPSYWCNP